jgi:hypothetical protein
MLFKVIFVFFLTANLSFGSEEEGDENEEVTTFQPPTGVNNLEILFH